MITQKEMAEAMKPSKGLTPQTSKTLHPNDKLVYTIIGQHDELVDDDGYTVDKDGYPLLWDIEDDRGHITPAEQREEAMAQSVLVKDNDSKKHRRRFYVKKSLSGQLYNPFGMYNELKHNKILHHAGRQEFIFKEVGQKVFRFYLNFLKTKNKAWLNNAERELA